MGLNKIFEVEQILLVKVKDLSKVFTFSMIVITQIS